MVEARYVRKKHTIQAIVIES